MSTSLSATTFSQRGHLCLPFETDAEKRDAVLSFVHEGLSRGARCVFTGSGEEFEELCRALDVLGDSADRAIARGALDLRTHEDTYLVGGVFDPIALIERTESLVDEALRNGFTGLCRTGELLAPPADDLWQQIVFYEARLNEYFARRPFSCLCRYPRAAVPPERVRDSFARTPSVIVRGEMCDNPFYERPELALSDDNRTRLDWQLRQLRVQHRAKRRLEEKTASAVTAAAELAIELRRAPVEPQSRRTSSPDRAATGRRRARRCRPTRVRGSPLPVPGDGLASSSCLARPAGIWP